MLLNKKSLLGIVIAGLAFIPTAYAAADGFYVGGQIGWGDIHQSNLSRSDMDEVLNQIFGVDNYTVNAFGNSGSDTGLAGRLFAGYQFNTTWAAEFGWSKFTTMNSKASASGVNDGNSFTASASGDIKASAVDLVAKATYVLPNSFSIYGKLGAAYLMESVDATVTVAVPPAKESGSDNDSQNKLFPTFGLGVAYDITDNVVADLSWNRIQSVGDSDLGSTDLVSVGLNYHFG